MSAAEVKPGYKVTEVGVIPEEWDIAKIEQLADIISGGTPSTSIKEYWDGGIPWCTPSDITANSEKYLRETARTISAEGLRNSSATLLPAGTLLLCSRATIGEVKIAAQPTATNQGFKSLVVRSEIAENEFLYYKLLTLKSRLIEKGVGSTFLEVSRRDVGSLAIPLPPLPEQRAIAAALGDVDALLAALERLIAKRRAVKQAAMDALLSGRVRLPGFGGERKRVSIDRDAVLKARIGWQGLTTEEYLTDGDYYLVTGTDFGADGRINWKTCFFIDQWRYSQDPNIQLQLGDVLLTKDGTIGKVAYVDVLPSPATLNSGVFVIRPRNDVFASLYLFHVLTSNIFTTFLGLLQAGSTIAHLYQKDFVKFSFSVPPLPEQRAIAEVLSDMDAAIAALERQRAKVQALKQGMMADLLTGRVRLVK